MALRIGDTLCDGAFAVHSIHDVANHQFTELRPAIPDWLDKLAPEYRRLRTRSDVRPAAVKARGITVADSARVLEMLSRLVPEGSDHNFNVVRSDLAELVLLLLAEREHGARFAYKGISDRELIKLPGRGADALAVEGNFEVDGCILVGEAKTSTARSVPAVVQTKEDSLWNQHRHHASSPGELALKLISASRWTFDLSIQNDFLAAAAALDDGIDIDIVCGSVLVRPENQCLVPEDFACFVTDFHLLLPARIRFYILTLPDGISSAVEGLARLARNVSYERGEAS